MRNRFLLLLFVLFIFSACRPNTSSTSRPPSINLLDTVRISTKTGALQPLPIANEGLTVVNLFDEFCSECPTGSRFQTVTRLNQSSSPPGKIVLVFSDTHFSSQDMDNFKTILSNDALVLGDIEAVKPYLNKGKLLVVFDSTRKIVWQEQPGMTEEQVVAAVSKLF